MTKKNQVKSKQQSLSALELEKSGDQPGAIKLYQKAATTDPLNVQAWNRQMILYRRYKSKEQEVKLIKTAIDQYKRSADNQQQSWLKENREKAESTKGLAKALGLLGLNGMPMNNDHTLEKWQTRLYLLEYRLKNARKKKTSNPPKPTRSKSIVKKSQDSRVKKQKKKVKPK